MGPSSVVTDIRPPLSSDGVPIVLFFGSTSGRSVRSVLSDVFSERHGLHRSCVEINHATSKGVESDGARV